MKIEYRSSVAVFVLFCIGIYSSVIHLTGFDFSLIPGNMYDGRLNNYFLEHGYKWISGDINGFWSAHFFYPAHNTMALSDNHLATMPIYSAFRFVHFDRETSYQLWFLVIASLNFFSCLWVLRRISLSTEGAAAGAYIFTFSLPVMFQVSRSQLMPRFMIPFAFYVVLRYLEKRSLKDFALVCLCVVVQFYCGIYLGYFLVLGLFAFAAAYWVYSRKPEPERKFKPYSLQNIPFHGLIILAALVLLLPLMVPYYKTSLEYGFTAWQDIQNSLPRLQSYFLPTYGSLCWSWLGPLITRFSAPYESHLFVGGIPVLLLACLPIVYRNNRTDRIVQVAVIAFISLVILFFSTLYAGGSLYKYVSALLPGIRAVRQVSRVILMDLFLIALIVGVVITKIQESKTTLLSYSFNPYLLIIALSLIIAADQFVLDTTLLTYSKSEAQVRAKNLEERILQRNPGTRLFAYMPQKSGAPEHFVHLDAMIAAQDLNIATVNGYSGLFPKGYEEFFKEYDRCGSLKTWQRFAEIKYGKSASTERLFNTMTIIGQDCYNSNGHL